MATKDQLAASGPAAQDPASGSTGPAAATLLKVEGLTVGYGSPPPASDWGLLIANGQNFATAPWLVYGPAIVIVLTVLSINRISRWLRKTS